MYNQCDQPKLLIKLLIKSVQPLFVKSNNLPPPAFRSLLVLPCRKAHDGHVSQRHELFCCTWSLFAVVLATASMLSPLGTNTSAELQPRERQSDRQRSPNPGQVWGCVWYASPRYEINTRPVSRSALPGWPQGSTGLSSLTFTCLDGDVSYPYT